MSVSGRSSVGLIRCTGRYDNISFRIKTPYIYVCMCVCVFTYLHVIYIYTYKTHT